MRFTEKNFDRLIKEVRQCRLCEAHLPYDPNPVLAASAASRLILIGQAPGIKAHQSSTPWNDASGNRLRDWLGIEFNTFYNAQYVSLVPMGFCFPGYVRGADAPPRKECAPTWHERLLRCISPQLTVLIGRYAQQYYLPSYPTLTQAVKEQNTPEATLMVLPHPSGRNNRWLRQNPWFIETTLPLLKNKVRSLRFESHNSLSS
ncbi:uracil-DNA glycosylase family protein [Alteromonas sp. H39]|uniref:uracil-DNA glycosylase family protein n=1 Tax=Alteromonas sp. H39 TaxID=3389876 RepID=UPI0039E1927A